MNRVIFSVAILVATFFFPTEIWGGSLLVSDDDGWLWRVERDGEAEKLFRTDVVMSDIASYATGFEGVLFGFHFEGDSDALYRIDLESKETIFVGESRISEYGPIGRQEPTALTFDDDGRLLVATFNAPGFRNGLVTNHGGLLGTLDPNSGFADLIGIIGYGSSGGLAARGDDIFMSSCRLAGFLFQCSKNRSNRLIRIDPVTGDGTILGEIGYAGVSALVFDGLDLIGLTEAGHVLLIDQVTGRGRQMARTTPLIHVTGATNFPRGAYELRLVPEPSGELLLLIGMVVLFNQRPNSRSQREYVSSFFILDNQRLGGGAWP